MILYAYVYLCILENCVIMEPQGPAKCPSRLPKPTTAGNNKWSLKIEIEIFFQIVQCSGSPAVDLFGSDVKHHAPSFQTEQTNALMFTVMSYPAPTQKWDNPSPAAGGEKGCW